MKYALLIYSPSTAEEYAAAWRRRAVRTIRTASGSSYTLAAKEAGVLVAAEQLTHTETATSVRVRGEDRLITDGPFMETKEHLLGFYLIDVPDLDAALRLGGPDAGRQRRNGRGPGGDIGDGVAEGTGLTLEHAFREEWGAVVATLARRLGDLQAAEDAAAEAFAAAAAGMGGERRPAQPRRLADGDRVAQGGRRPPRARPRPPSTRMCSARSRQGREATVETQAVDARQLAAMTGSG